MARILSFDIGKINLAYCLIEVDDDPKIKEEKKKMDDRVTRVKGWCNRFVRNLMDLSLLQRLIAVIVGILGGLFPVPSITTLVTVFLAKTMGCNPEQIAISTSINLILTPVDIYCVPKFATLTSTALGYGTVYTAAMFLEYMSEGIVHLVTAGGAMIVMALVSWVTITTVVLLVTKAASNRIVYVHAPREMQERP